MIRLQNVSKTFMTADGEVNAVQNVSLTVEKGDVFGIIGLSGAGKSTLVRCINFLEKPTDGKVFFEDVDLASLSEKALRETRRRIGMIFQNFNLLAQRTALRNVCYPLEIAGVPKAKAVEKAMRLLETVGLADRAGAYPSQLSGGQKQRVAVASAIASGRDIMLFDEPTSGLDYTHMLQIGEILRNLKAHGKTVIVVTHDRELIKECCDQEISLHDFNQI